MSEWPGWQRIWFVVFEGPDRFPVIGTGWTRDLRVDNPRASIYQQPRTITGPYDNRKLVQYDLCFKSARAAELAVEAIALERIRKLMALLRPVDRRRVQEEMDY